jgi:hypothetical protein
MGARHLLPADPFTALCTPIYQEADQSFFEPAHFFFALSGISEAIMLHDFELHAEDILNRS